MNRLNVKDLQNDEIAYIAFNKKERDYIELLASSPRAKDRELALDYIDTSSDVLKNLNFILKIADLLVPDRNNNIRWRTLGLVENFIRDYPSKVWPFVVKYGGVSNKDIRAGVGCCLLEHMLQYHYSKYLPETEKLLYLNKNYIDTFKYCWYFGNEELENGGSFGDEKFEHEKREFERKKAAIIEKARKYWRTANRSKLKPHN